MDNKHSDWLPQLSSQVIKGIEGNFLDAYAVALEGWRRGLTLKWHMKDSEKFKNMKTWFVDQPGQLFSLQSHKNTHYFFRTRGDKVPNEAVEQAMDKQQTKKMLKAANVPFPEGRLFNSEHAESEIINYCTSLGYPVVVKPQDGSFGRGVVTGIQDEVDLRQALHYLQKEMNEESIIVEKHVSGYDYRLYVVGDKVEGAILRTPPNITGDGINTIATLIQQKNDIRKLNPRLISCPILVDNETINYLNNQQLTLETVPEEGQLIYTNNKANISLGGDPIDVLDELSDDMKEIAVHALKAVPNLEHGAVDLMIEKDNQGKEVGYVIELNPTAQLGGILFPIEGQARDIPSAIIDFYFPETKNDSKNNQLFFDFQEALIPLNKGIATEVKISTCQTKQMKAKKLVLSGEYLSDISLTVRNEAVRSNLHGSIRTEAESNIEIIIIGSNENIEIFQKTLVAELLKDVKYQLNEFDWKDPIKIGFSLKDGTHHLIKDINNLKEDTLNYQKKLRTLEKEYNHIVNSTSWKLTTPIRMITGKLKNK